MIRQLLKKYWGYDDFRPLQEEVITSIMQGHDTLVLMTTGGGKSLCYQIPALAKEGVCLVISPLVALMKDQVEQLCKRGVKASLLVSGMNQYEQEIVLNKCLYGSTKLLYVSPERLSQHLFLQHFRQMKVSLIAVDEAHCISQWGYDFRPSYLQLASIRPYHPEVPVLALTATATENVIVDIQDKLQFRNGNLFRQSFYRENLSYMVFAEEAKRERLLRIASKVGGCGIVYVGNRRRTQEVAQFLNAAGVSATFYHAGLTPQQRDQRQQQWMKNAVRVMVATNAFGMGIDKPDVRFVVHLDFPSSLEAYFQEAGRAGRDGQRSYAVLLYDASDLERLEQRVEDEYPPLKHVQNVYCGLCNFFQIPVGGGEGRCFDFDIEQLCKVYAFPLVECYSSLRLLEKENLLSMPDPDDSVSKLHIIESKETLYRFQVENSRYGDLIQLLLRMYGGLFSDFVPITESQIAKRLLLDTQTVINMLQYLDALKLVSYKKRSTNPQICFVTSRIDAKDLTLRAENYNSLKLIMEERIEAVKHYATATNQCRSRMLLEYFGETGEACGTCDVCLVQKHDERLVEDAVVRLLQQNPLSIKQLVGQLQADDNLGLSVSDEAFLQGVVRRMVDARRIGINRDFMLYV